MQEQAGRPGEMPEAQKTAPSAEPRYENSSPRKNILLLAPGKRKNNREIQSEQTLFYSSPPQSIVNKINVIAAPCQGTPLHNIIDKESQAATAPLMIRKRCHTGAVSLSRPRSQIENGWISVGRRLCERRLSLITPADLQYNLQNDLGIFIRVSPGVVSMKHLVIVPALNEEMTIGLVIEEIKHGLPFSDILVVNDGSTDHTGAIALQKGAAVINHPFNLGYGAALQTGFRFAKKRDYDYVITMDADGQHISASATSLIHAMQQQNADVVIGSRFTGTGYKMGVLRTTGVMLFSVVAKAYTGIQITDPTSGFQLINRRAFSYLAEGDNYPLDYPDVNIIMALHKKEFRIVEAPVTMKENEDGKSMHSGLRPLLYVLKMFLAIIMVLVRGRGK